MDGLQDREDGEGRRAPWWLRPPAGLALIAVLLLLNRLVGGVVVPLAMLVLLGSVLLLGAAVLLPGVRMRWFGRG